MVFMLLSFPYPVLSVVKAVGADIFDQVQINRTGRFGQCLVIVDADL
jgi:hypothetical protein